MYILYKICYLCLKINYSEKMYGLRYVRNNTGNRRILENRELRELYQSPNTVQ